MAIFILWCFFLLLVSVHSQPNASNEINLFVANRVGLNRLELRCRETSGEQLVSGAVFCDRLPQQLVGESRCRSASSPGSFTVDVTPDTEAIWTCRNSSNYSSLELWITARPTPPDGVLQQEFIPSIVSSVMLPCDYQRGRLGDLYSVNWCRTPPDSDIPILIDEENSNRIDNESFSLTVDPVMIGSRYFCKVTIDCEGDGERRCASPGDQEEGNKIILCPVNGGFDGCDIIPTVQPSGTVTTNDRDATTDKSTQGWPIPVILTAVFALTTITVLTSVGFAVWVMKRRKNRPHARSREPVAFTTIKQSTSTTSISAVGDGSTRVVLQQVHTEANVTSAGDSGNYTQSCEEAAVVVAAVNPTAAAVTPSATLPGSSLPHDYTNVHGCLPLPIAATPSSYSGQQSRSYAPSLPPSSMCTVSGQLEPLECIQPASFIPFVGPLEVFQCSSLGGVYQTPNDISIRIPNRAIPEGSTFRIEFGTALYGPFDFPGQSKAISPVILLRVLPDNDHISHFLLPVKLKLPHYFDLCEEDLVQGKVGFMTAPPEDDNDRVHFKPPTDGQCLYTPKHKYGTITVKEFSGSCYYCLTCKDFPQLSISRGLYTLVKVVPQPVPAKAWDMHFCVTYAMKPFIEAIRRQYRGRAVKVSAHPQWRFKFSPAESSDSEPAIRIALHYYQGHTTGWQLTLEPNIDMIELLELDVWRNDPMLLSCQEEDRHYPPRFTIEVSGEAAVESSEVLVSFAGIEERFAEKMKTKVSLPYIHPQGMSQAVVPYSTPPHPNYQSMNQAMMPYTLPPPTTVARHPLAFQGYYQQDTYHEETQHDPSDPSNEELLEAAKEITGILRTSWTMLLTYLKIPKHLAADIETDKSLVSAVSRTLQVWRSLNTSSNKRDELATLLEKTDPRLHSVGRKLREGPGGVRHCLQQM